MPANDAFDAMLSSHSLYQVLSNEGNIVTIHNPEEALKLTQSGVGKIARSSLEKVTDIFKIHYADLEQIKTSLEEIFKNQGSNSENQASDNDEKLKFQLMKEQEVL